MLKKYYRLKTHLEAKLLFTSTIPTLQPLYIVLAIRLFTAELPSALEESPLPSPDDNSIMLESLALITCLPDDPTSTSDMSADLEVGERTVIPSDIVPIDIFLLAVIVKAVGCS